MNDHHDAQHNAQSNAADTGMTGDAQSPLLLNEMQSPDEMFAPVKSGQRANQAVVGGLLVVGAIGAIIAMRQLGMGPALSLAGIDIDYKPQTTASQTRPGKVLADLERSRRAVQVPADQITQDPFELQADQTTIAEPTVDPDLARRAELERQRLAREQHEQELTEAAGQLQLQSVMGGSVPIARINGGVYKVGMRVAERFTVTAIEGRSVTLEADGLTFTLTMDQND